MNGPEDRPKLDLTKPPPPDREDEWYLAVADQIEKEMLAEGIDLSKYRAKPGSPKPWEGPQYLTG